MPLRGHIKNVATELLIRHGYRGMSFGDIALLLGTTRANIHYHFGNKQKLMEEVVEEYVDGTLRNYRKIWLDESKFFIDKIENTGNFNRKRYFRFNTAKDNGHPWSLIARLRTESDIIGDQAIQALQRFSQGLSDCILKAVTMAIRKEEFVSTAPAEDISIQIVSIANSAGPITQDAGNFDSLEQLYLAFSKMAQAAYGTPAKPN